MNLKGEILLFLLLQLGASESFLMEDLLTKNAATTAVPAGSINIQVPSSLNDKYLQDLIRIIADEKAARHQLKNMVTTLKGEVNQMADKISLVERFHVEVEKELRMERNKSEKLENDIAYLKSEIAIFSQKCLNACMRNVSQGESSVNNQNTLMMANLSKHLGDLQEDLQRNISVLTMSVIHENTVMVDNISKHFSRLEEDLKTNISNQMTSASVVIANLTKSVSDLMESYNVLANGTNYQLQHLQFDAERNRSTTIIAFEAHVVGKINALGGERLVFTNVVLNHGLTYNTTSGIFTAPVSGLYLFHLQICLNDAMYFWVKMKSDSKPLMESCFNDDAENGIVGCTSTSAFGVLKMSERVWIEGAGMSDGKHLWYATEAWNSFAGALLVRL